MPGNILKYNVRNQKNKNILTLTDFPINSVLGIIFFVFNPMYAVFIAAVISLNTRKNINILWAGFLYSISFALLFFNQIYIRNSDIRNYISFYQNFEEGLLEEFTYTYLFERFASDFIHNEFLWFAYTKFINVLTGNNYHIFIFITYFIIFGLSAYLTYMICKYHNYNYLFYLFIIINLNMTFLYSAYEWWRHVIAGLLFFIGLAKFNSGPSNILPRIIFYSSALVHIVTIPLIICFEIYNIINVKSYYVKYNNRFFINIIVFLLLFVFVIINQQYITQIAHDIPNLRRAFELQFNNYVQIGDNIRILLSPIVILFLSYYIINKNRLLSFEVFILILFILLNLLPQFYSFIPAVLFGRIQSLLMIIIPLIVAKLLVRNSYYGLIILGAIFMYRFYTYLDPNIIHSQAAVGYGNYFNPFYGILLMLLFYKNPIIDPMM